MSDDRRRSVSLETPDRKGLQDPGAHELGMPQSQVPITSSENLTISALVSDSDDHFSDAQSGSSETPVSPVPKLRVEKVDDEPSYGEVPGTEAYEKRTGDAAPDEIAIIPDADDNTEAVSSADTPGGQPIPKTVVDETADQPGSKTHHFHEDAHKADATPDFVRKPDGTGEVSTMPASLETTGQAPGTTVKSS